MILTRVTLFIDIYHIRAVVCKMTVARANRFICGAASEWQRVHKYRYNSQAAGLPFALIIVVLTLSAHCHVINCQYTDSTSSPCPDTFQYRSNGYEQYGVGQIRQPPIGEDIHVMVHLIVGARLQSVSVSVESEEIWVWGREPRLKRPFIVFRTVDIFYPGSVCAV